MASCAEEPSAPRRESEEHLSKRTSCRPAPERQAQGGPQAVWTWTVLASGGRKCVAFVPGSAACTGGLLSGSRALPNFCS